MGSRLFEMSEFLVQRLEVEDLGAVFPARVAFHPTCHSIRGIQVGDAPERLLRAVTGLELVEVLDPRECCGFGGTFSVKNAGVSLAMLADKVAAIRDSGAQVLTAVDNSCLLHMAGGLHRLGLLRRPSALDGASEGIRVMHLAEILERREGVQT